MDRSAQREDGAPFADFGDLTIRIHPHGAVSCEYFGTRMQLESEGVIPAGTKWPDGFGCTQWEINGLEFWLWRSRPEGARGRRRDFIDIDYWRLGWGVSGPYESDEVAIARKWRELAQMIHARSPEGRAESERAYRLYYAALQDERFQAFKALIPCLNPPPRKRRAKGLPGEVNHE